MIRGRPDALDLLAAGFFLGGLAACVWVVFKVLPEGLRGWAQLIQQVR